MEPRERATFDAGEIAVVLSHYDLGVVESITEFPRGSRRSPKVGIVAERGKFLLKRRPASRAQPDRVRLIHRVQLHLAAAGFPLAPLAPTRDGNRTFVQLRDRVYELFEFVAGHPYERTADETFDAGEVLARFHQATEKFEAPPTVLIPRGDYHDAPAVRTGLCAIGSTLSSHDSFTGDDAELAVLIQHLLGSYDHAADAAAACDLTALPERLIHSDWHPGNLLFRKGKIIAVVDYDSVRLARRIIDVANGALQFSILAGGDPATWPSQLDDSRFAAFLSGYRSLLPLDPRELRAVAPLMIQALIAECVPPIAETGSIGPWTGYRVLQMVRRKVQWIEAHASELSTAGRKE